MKILHISNKPVYPQVDGGSMAMKQFLSCLLHADCTVKHLTISTDKHPFSETAYPESVRNAVQPESVYADTKVTPWKALPHLFGKRSYNIDRFYVQEMTSRIIEILQTGNFDAVVLDSLFVTPYLEDIRKHFGGKVVVRTHNVESDIWQDLTKNTSNPLKRWFLKKLTKDLRRYENTVLQNVNGILSISDDDAQRFRSLGITTPIRTIPVVVETAGNLPESGNDLFHVGSMDWAPNIDAVNRLLKIFPEIRKQQPDTKLFIAGRHAQQVLTGRKQESVIVEDFVDDLQSFMQKAGILAAPINSGSGVRIKILETMAAGIPVVTTSKGALGINCRESSCLLIGDSDEAFADACLRLIRNEDLRKEIAGNALEYIRKNHNIDTASADIIEFLQST